MSARREHRLRHLEGRVDALEKKADALDTMQQRTGARLFEMSHIQEVTMEPSNDPLTVDELREMDGMPVWVCEPDGANGVWGLVDLEYQMIRLHGGGLAIWENNDKSWLAYGRKPEDYCPECQRKEAEWRGY